MGLLNGNFEADWGTQSSHKAHVFPVGGDPYFADIGNIFTPPHWVTWYRHQPGIWDQPEVRDAWKNIDPRRVCSGEKGILFFTFYRKHWGGFYQNVPVTRGQTVEFSCHLHAWSNHDGYNYPHKHDGRWSEGVGYNVVSIHESNIEPDSPIDAPDPQHDAIRNFQFRVGIDPTGGINPLADSVVWSGRYSNYNGYLAPLVIEAIARTDSVTVFTESKTAWAFCHNDFYADDADLEVVADPEPPTGNCRGKPRSQYKRTYNVISPTATEDEAVDIFREGWRRSRETTGGSYDDAGIGDLDVRKINLHGLKPAEVSAHIDFYEQFYPGVELKFILKNTPPEPEPPITGEPQYPYNPAPLVSIHMQGNYRGDMEFINSLRPAVVKFCTGVERANNVPDGVLTVGRFHRNDQSRYWERVEPEVGAAMYMDEIEASLRNCPRLDYVESLNEFVDSGKPWQMHRVIRFEVAFCHELKTRGLPQKPVLLTAGVGNPYLQGESPLDENGLTDIEQMLPAVEACIELGGALGPHTYWDYHDGQSYLGAGWQYHAGRPLESWDPVFRAHGLYPRYIFGECGICSRLLPMDGWQMVCNLEQYSAELIQYQKWLREWNALHGNRVIGATIFTCGGTSEWHEFEVGPYLGTLAAALR